MLRNRGQLFNQWLKIMVISDFLALVFIVATTRQNLPSLSAAASSCSSG